jgi:hypothetical protein
MGQATFSFQKGGPRIFLELLKSSLSHFLEAPMSKIQNSPKIVLGGWYW